MSQVCGIKTQKTLPAKNALPATTKGELNSLISRELSAAYASLMSQVRGIKTQKTLRAKNALPATENFVDYEKISSAELTIQPRIYRILNPIKELLKV
jgi:hypothetical protein